MAWTIFKDEDTEIHREITDLKWNVDKKNTANLSTNENVVYEDRRSYATFQKPSL